MTEYTKLQDASRHGYSVRMVWPDVTLNLGEVTRSAAGWLAFTPDGSTDGYCYRTRSDAKRHLYEAVAK